MQKKFPVTRILPLLVLLSCESPPVPADSERPNILIVILDALRADHVGFYGYPRPTTPEIDRICSESLVFSQAFTVAPYTIAATASLFTGLYPETHGVVDHGTALAENVPTLAESFQQAGYRTLLVANSAFLAPEFGLNRGFDVYLDRADYAVDRSERLTAEVLAQLETISTPFLAYVHYLRPHWPYDAPEEIREVFGRAGQSWQHRLMAIDRGEIPLTDELKTRIIDDYDSSLRTVDAEVGKLYRYLSQKGLLESTVLVITSDHGEAFGEHGRITHNSTVFDEMVQVPLVIRYPAKLAPEVRPDLAQTVDLFATVAELAGIGHPSSQHGLSLLGKPREHAFLRTTGAPPTFGLRTTRFKLVQSPQGLEIYDLASDPDEKNPLARGTLDPGMEQEVRQLEAVFGRWLEQCLSSRTGPRQLPELPPGLLERLRSLGYVQ